MTQVRDVLICCCMSLLLCFCKKDEAESAATGNPPYITASLLAGSWKGTVSVRDSMPQYCKFSDPSWQVSQQWTAAGDSVHIIENVKTVTFEAVYIWSGYVKNDSVYLTSKRDISCIGSSYLSTLHFNNKIKVTSKQLQLNGRCIYPMCPSFGCIFVLTYNLSKNL